MKTKSLLILAAVAVVTLSFTFASKKAPVNTTKATQSESIGGFVSEDKF